jgi:PAS domain S-box-containing protein
MWLLVVPMKLNLKLSHKALILIAVPLLFEVVFIAVMACIVNNAEQEAQRELKSKSVIATADAISELTEQAFLALYSYNKDPDPIVLRRYRLKMNEIKSSLEELTALTAGNAQETELTQKAGATFKEGEAVGSFVLGKMERGESLDEKDLKAQNTLPLRLQVFRISHELTSLLHRMGALERGQREALSTRRYRGLELPLLLVGVLANFLIAIALAMFFNAGTTRRLRVLMDNSNRLARGATLSQRLSGTDELAELDRVFHTMADALQEAMLKERSIVANAVDVICTVDEKLYFKSVSPASIEVFGQAPDDLVGLRLASIILPEDLERAKSDFERMRSETDTPFFENRIKRNDGVVDVRWSVYWSDAEKAYYCVVSDISARREVERLKQEFVSMMSHDLRTPLMSIQAALSLLSIGASGDLSPSAKRNVIDAERNISYIISLINSLIDVERMDSAKLNVHCVPTEVLPLLEAAIQAVRSLATNKGITLECAKIDPDLEVNADGDRVIQVLINLLSNALKFSPRDTTIRLIAVINPDNIELQVSDEGRGIPEDQLDTVFARFAQVKESDATQHKGSGLGLAICKSIVEAHGGSIGARSSEGKGTTFWFTLPRLVGTADGVPSSEPDQMSSIL